jgi:hypothetical protein
MTVETMKRDNVVDLEAARRARRKPEPKPEPVASLPWHIEVCRWCLAHQPLAMFNPREVTFLMDMTGWMELPSPRQALWIEALESRVKTMLERTGGGAA